MNRYVFKITDFSQTSDSSINWQGCQRLILSWCIKQRNNLRVLPMQSYAFLEVWVLPSCLFCVRKQFCMIKMQKFAWEAVKYPRPTMGQQQFNGNSPVDCGVAVHLGLLVIQKVGCQTRGIYTKKTSQRIHVSPQQLILKS